MVLETDVTITSPDGRSAYSVIEMYAIQIGLEPDPKLFDLQHNFTIYKPEAAEPAPSKKQ